MTLSSPQSEAHDHPLIDSTTACIANVVTERLCAPAQHQGPAVERPSFDISNACFKKRSLESSRSSVNAAVADTELSTGSARHTHICMGPFNIDAIHQPSAFCFSQAAMEVRVDRDWVETHKGKIWIENNLFLEEKPLRGTYWAPFWNAANVAEQLSSEQALFNLKGFLKN